MRVVVQQLGKRERQLRRTILVIGQKIVTMTQHLVGGDAIPTLRSDNDLLAQGPCRVAVFQALWYIQSSPQQR
jgi:hypothetical protein